MHIIKQLLIFSLFLTRYVFAAPVEGYTPLTTFSTICSSTNCYTMTAELGKGACGEVFEALDSRGQLYALKLFSNPIFSADAKRVYELGSTLQHRNIIRSVDFIFDDTEMNNPKAYIILELVRGQTLSCLANRALTFDKAVNLCLQFIDAMRYSLNHCVMHVDMHLANLMIDKDCVLKIIDIDSFFYSDTLLAYKNELLDIENHSIMRLKSASSLLAFYFDKMITEVCIEILCKSNLDRNEKINMRLSIKKLAWECLEDVEERQYILIDDYLDHLVYLLEYWNHSQYGLQYPQFF